MRRPQVIFLAAVIGLLALAAPIFVSVLMARADAEAQSRGQLRVLTDDMLRRVKNASAQVDEGLKALMAITDASPCSPDKLNLMRRLAASAEYVTALGAMQGNALVCSTLTEDESPVMLGPPERVSRSGVRSWSGIMLPEIAEATFNVVAKDGYAAIVTPRLAIDIVNDGSDISLVQVDAASGTVVRSHGAIEASWFKRYPGRAASFLDDDYLFLLTPSENGEQVAIAAMPAFRVDERFRSLAPKYAFPGLLAGVLLAFCVYLFTRRRLSIKTALRLALDRKEFFMLYQPVVNLQTGACVGAEALIRWNRADGQTVSPVVFIPAAEAAGMIRRITARVMEIVAVDAAELIARNPEAHIAINLSAEDIHAPQTQSLLRQLLHNARASAKNIIIEATERGLMFPEKARGMLIAMRSQGFKVAIDDFGTGNSSLSYLATYELDFLKIDKSFVDALGINTVTSKIAFHIIDMARSLGLQMIAEGVETESQRDILRDAGVQFAQGWLFAKPMPMQDLMKFMQTA
jgi:sensor c-di-GMP phosphodiesterase-like protein